MVIGLVALAFLTGGGSRSDIQSLVILRPLAIVACGYGLWTLTADQVRQYRVLLALFSATFLLVLLQLVPLPPSIWHALPGRTVVEDIDRLVGVGEIWRPLSMAPTETWNAFYSLFVPFALFLLVVQLDSEERYLLLPVFLGFGLLSGLMGAMQAIGAGGGLLYFYRVTNDGIAVGLFANRNHAAVYLACLFPMLAIYASLPGKSVRLRIWLSIAAGLVLVPLILATGSRAGMLVALVGLCSVPLLYRSPETYRAGSRAMEAPSLGETRLGGGARRSSSADGRRGRRPGKGWSAFFSKLNHLHLVYLFGGLAVLALGAISMWFSRGTAIDRLLESRAGEARGEIWQVAFEMAREYFPFGSGFGTFPQIFKLGEPQTALGPSYANHAHNDWLELVMTGGLPAALLLAVTVYAGARQSWVVWRPTHVRPRETAYARMASVIFLMLALASIGDYPLRVPSMMCFAAVLALWLTGDSAGLRASATRR